MGGSRHGQGIGHCPRNFGLRAPVSESAESLQIRLRVVVGAGVVPRPWKDLHGRARWSAPVSAREAAATCLSLRRLPLWMMSGQSLSPAGDPYHRFSTGPLWEGFSSDIHTLTRHTRKTEHMCFSHVYLFSLWDAAQQAVRVVLSLCKRKGPQGTVSSHAAFQLSRLPCRKSKR